MALITWLLTRLKTGCDDSVQIALSVLFDSYKFESLESAGFHKLGIKNEKVFSEYIHKILPDLKKLRQRVGTQYRTFFTGVSLKSLEPIGGQVAEKITNIPSYLTSGFVFKKMENNFVECFCETSYLCNGNRILKNVTFSPDGTWKLSISGKDVDLESIGIDKHFIVQKENIDVICQQANLVELCQGVTISKSVICTRFHTLDVWEKSHENHTKCKKLHSLMCKKVVSVIAKVSTCRICQKMTFGKMHGISRGKNKENECNFEKDANGEDGKQKKVSKQDFKKLIPAATDKMLELLMSQATNVGKDPRGRRYSKDILSICLKLYTRSPHGYKTLIASNMLVLPSPSLLILYKNNVNHKVGFHDDIFLWMHSEAKRLEVPPEGMVGGIILDEMSIQSDLQMTKCGDVYELVGFTDLGEEGNMCQVLKTGKRERTLGTHILQLMFLGLTGFRFPFSHFISNTVSASELHTLFWEAIDHLQMYDFTVAYTCMDGAPSNRSFMHINIGKHSTIETVSMQNLCDLNSSVTFMMDYSHCIKKVRNNLLKSGISKFCTRNLMLVDETPIQWQMWIDCFKWDRQNALQIHRKLTADHIFLNSQSKMRNHLAEEVLNTDMLSLFIQYQASLGDKGSILNGAIQLLKQTSSLVSFFRDMRPIRDINDQRLQELQEILSWFMDWSSTISNDPNISKKEKASKLMSQQCIEDIQSCIIGFLEMCRYLLQNKCIRNVFITPALINSDVIENEFNQQRSTYNGANSNPTALQYQKTLNSILLGQNIISTKSNAGKTQSAAQPYAFTNPKPLKCSKKKKSSLSMDSLTPAKQIKVLRM